MLLPRSFYDDILKLNDLTNVYQRNYYNSHFTQIEKVFLSCEKVLGVDNFKFFIDQFVRLAKAESPNLDMYGQDFADYLSSRNELEEMGYIKHLAKLDFFWFEQSSKSIELPFGILDFWGKLINEKELSNIEIDEDIMETISILKDEQGDSYLSASCLK